MIELKVTAENAVELHKALAAILTGSGNAPASMAKDESPAPKATPPAAAKAIAPAAPAPKPAAPVAAAPAAKTYKIEDVAAVVNGLAKAGKDHVIAALAEFGAKKGGELKPEQWGEFIEKGNARLAALG